MAQPDRKNWSPFSSCMASCFGTVALLIGIPTLIEAIETGVVKGSRGGSSFYHTRADDPFAYWANIGFICVLIPIAAYVLFNGVVKFVRWLGN